MKGYFRNIIYGCLKAPAQHADARHAPVPATSETLRLIAGRDGLTGVDRLRKAIPGDVR